MRLIDADKIIITRQEYVGALTLKERLQRLLKFQPTVEAIPVEWLKTQIEKCQEISNTSKTVGLAILAETINQWEKENGLS